jgi:hypothetical protein
MQRGCLLFAILFGAMSLWASNGVADGIVAVGLPSGGPKQGVVYGYSESRTQALNLCRGNDTANNDIPNNASVAQHACTVVGVYKNQCVAFALNGDAQTVASGFGWAIAADSDSAKTQAIANCDAMAGSGSHRPCVVQRYACDGSAN